MGTGGRVSPRRTLQAVGLIAGQLAVSLRNARLYAVHHRIADEQAALRRVATLVARGGQPRDVFIAVAEEAGRLLAADFSVLIRYDPPTGTLEIAGSWLRSGSTEPPTAVGGRLPLGGHSVSSLVYQTGRPTRIDDERDDLSGSAAVAAGLCGGSARRSACRSSSGAGRGAPWSWRSADATRCC